jgi:hypoxanthine-DNA glycosylase
LSKEVSEKMIVEHTFKPIYGKNSEILILGSIPSIISRENNFYYGNDKNRFWKLISTIFNEEYPVSNEDKKNIILKNNLALFDVVKSCSIKNSSDSSISNVKINDINSIIHNSNIKKIIFNGNKAYELYLKYENNKFKNIVCLPSTSPANAKYSFDMLLEIWKRELLI